MHCAAAAKEQKKYSKVKRKDKNTESTMAMIFIKKQGVSAVPSPGILCLVPIAASERHTGEIDWLREMMRMTGIWRICSYMRRMKRLGLLRER